MLILWGCSTWGWEFFFFLKHMVATFQAAKLGSSAAALSCGSARVCVWECVLSWALCFHIWASVGEEFDILSWDRASAPQGPACPFEKFSVRLHYLRTAWSSLSLGLPWDTRGGLTIWISRCSSGATVDCPDNPSPSWNEKKKIEIWGEKKFMSCQVCFSLFDLFSASICSDYWNHGLAFSQM